MAPLSLTGRAFVYVWPSFVQSNPQCLPPYIATTTTSNVNSAPYYCQRLLPPRCPSRRGLFLTKGKLFLDSYPAFINFVRCSNRYRVTSSARRHSSEVICATDSSEAGSSLDFLIEAPRWRAQDSTSGSQNNCDAGKNHLKSQNLCASANATWMTMSAHVLAAMVVGTLAFGIGTAEATDALKTCGCLLKECRVELARCIADPGCAANVACLQTCNNRPDETECQIACGDLFENKVVDQFNDCAVSKKGCVPQKSDEGRFPVPPPTAIVPEFKTTDFSGKWFISSGLNKTFDTFDCQLHEFSATPNSISGKLSWRIATPDGGFFTRSAVQNFVQDGKKPGVLYNHGNEFLHYQDDWYILSYKTEGRPDDYVFVYYRGSNDAWDGYGGAVVYTRSRILPSSIVPELTAAAKRAGLDFKKFTTTDNTCGPEPPLFARLEKKIEGAEEALAKEVKLIEMTVEDVGKKELLLLGRGAEELRRDEEQFLRNLGKEEKALLDELKMEASDIEELFGKAIPIRKLR